MRKSIFEIIDSSSSTAEKLELLNNAFRALTSDQIKPWLLEIQNDSNIFPKISNNLALLMWFLRCYPPFDDGTLQIIIPKGLLPCFPPVDDGTLRIIIPNDPKFFQAMGKHSVRDTIHQAAILNFPSLMKILIDQKADINAEDEEGNTPLHLAVKHNGLEVVRLLLEQKVPQLPNNLGQTPMLFASINGNCLMIRMLFEHKGDINSQTKKKYTPLITAIHKKHPQAVKALLELGADSTLNNIDGKYPMHYAVESGSAEILKLLVIYKADINTPDKIGQCTPMSRAAQLGDLKMVQLLLEAKADLQQRNKNGYSPLDSAVERGFLPVSQLLLEHMPKPDIPSLYFAAAKGGYADVLKLFVRNNLDINTPNELGQTPLSTAARWGNVNAARTLIEHKADFRPDIEGFSPTHMASQYGHLAVVQFFLEQKMVSKLDVLKPNKGGFYPIHTAIVRGHTNVVKSLLMQQADINIPDSQGFTLLHQAASNDRPEVVSLLLECKADHQIASSQGRSPLYYGAWRGSRKIINVLVEYKANVNSSHTPLDSPLGKAVAKGHADVVQCLLEHKADFRSEWLVHRAAAKGDRNVLACFVQHDKDCINLPSKSERNTPLHFILNQEQDDPLTTAWLLKNGASRKAKNFGGQTPFEVAIRHQKIKSALLVCNRFDVNEFFDLRSLFWVKNLTRKPKCELLIGLLAHSSVLSTVPEQAWEALSEEELGKKNRRPISRKVPVQNRIFKDFFEPDKDLFLELAKLIGLFLAANKLDFSQLYAITQSVRVLTNIALVKKNGFLSDMDFRLREKVLAHLVHIPAKPDALGGRIIKSLLDLEDKQGDNYLASQIRFWKLLSTPIPLIVAPPVADREPALKRLKIK